MRNSPGVKYGSHHPLGRKPVQCPVLTTYSRGIFVGSGLTSEQMKPPRVYTCGTLHFFGGIRRSTLLRFSSFKGSVMRIHPRAYTGGFLRRRIKTEIKRWHLTGNSRQRGHDIFLIGWAFTETFVPLLDSGQLRTMDGQVEPAMGPNT